MFLSQQLALWKRYRVTEDRGSEEISFEECERVRDYCQNAGDAEAFDLFGGEYRVLSPCGCFC